MKKEPHKKNRKIIVHEISFSNGDCLLLISFPNCSAPTLKSNEFRIRNIEFWCLDPVQGGKYSIRLKNWDDREKIRSLKKGVEYHLEEI